VPVVKTIDAYIEFRDRGDKIFLIVMQQKHFANYVATTLSNALFLNFRSIVEARIPHERLVELHERNPDGTRLIWFDQAFNSLSRDHESLTANSLSSEASEIRAFNSLSRDHRARFRDFPALRGFLPRHPFAQMISKTTIWIYRFAPL
jgi:hypothetical protein